MKVDLKGKQALVGGATSGLGKAVAVEFAKCGASVTLVLHSEDKLKELREELANDDGQKHDYLVADYADFDAYQKIIGEYFDSNEIDILLNNTQGPPSGNISDFDIDDYQEAFDLLFKVNCQTALLALPAMKRKRFGRIINASSFTVKEPSEDLVLSNTMRVAWLSWNKSLADFYAEDGITVNTIMTGNFDTQRITKLTEKISKQQNISPEEALQQRLEKIPAGRLGQPEEWAHLAAFLASEYASYLTGAAIPLDGGMKQSL